MLEIDNTAISEGRLLHPQKDGFFVIGQKTSATQPGKRAWAQKAYHMSSLEQVLSSVKNMPDLYVSQASFVTPRRIVSGMKSVSACFVDLDCYNLGILPDQSTVDAILAMADTMGLARPSYVVRSGCGLYAKWILDAPLSHKHIHAWNAAQKTLGLIYQSLGADPKAKDAARVLRATSTVNSKNGSIVEVAHVDGARHSFLNLAQNLDSIAVTSRLAVAEQTARRIKISSSAIAALEEAGAQDLSHLMDFSARKYVPIAMEGRGLTALNWKRFTDIRDLMIMRGGAKRGSRDLFIFWMASTLASAGIVDPSNFWGEIEQLLLSFPLSKDFTPLSDGSLDSLKSRIEAAHRGEKFMHKGVAYSPIYTPSNDTLINLFEITRDEEKKLVTIISASEKLRRADANVEGRAQRREMRNGAQHVALELKKQGKTDAEIARDLSVNRSTVGRWLKDGEIIAKHAAKQRLEDAQIMEWTQRLKTFNEESTRQREVTRQRNFRLQEIRYAQSELRIAIKVMALIDKAQAQANAICNFGPDGISSVRKTCNSHSANKGDDASDEATLND